MPDITSHIASLDHLLPLQVPATLAGLSLASATFITGVTRSTEGTSPSAHLERAKKFVIKAFFLLIVCTGLVFTFDFVEILAPFDSIILFDVLSTYGLFWGGLVYLFVAARQIYVSWRTKF